MYPRRSVPLLLSLIALGGCAAGSRGLETTHQPLVSAEGARVPDCPNWGDQGAPSQVETQSANFGCGLMSTLTAMIADPQDLLHGRAATTSTGELATRAIKANREVQPTVKNWTVTTSVSTGGK